MAIATATALAIGSLAMGAYSMNQQKSSQKKAQNTQQEAEMNSRRITAEQKPLEESATLGFNTDSTYNPLGSLGLLIEPDKAKRTTGLGSPAKTGVGISALTGLGFGG